MEGKHYLVDKYNIVECQKYLFRKGYKWSGVDDEIWNPIENWNFNHSYIENAVIHAYIENGIKIISWDKYNSITKNKYHIVKFINREQKLKRILNECK